MDLRRPWPVAFVVSSLLAACADEAGADRPDAGRPVRDVVGQCFEIGPWINPASATSQQPPHHTNPVSADMTIPVGQIGYLSVRYYNFCNDPDPRVLAVELLGPDGAPADPSFTYSGLAVPGYVITQGEPETFRVTFRPTAPGTKVVVVRVRYAHGYYQTTLTATGT